MAVDESYEDVRSKIQLASNYSSRKGKWQRRKGSDCWECSNCHAVLEDEDIHLHNFYYCYHCGSNMMTEYGYMNLEEK